MKNKKNLKSNDAQKKGIKNYFILIVIFLVVIFVTLYFCNWYNVYNEYAMETPVIRGTLFELIPDEIDHYVQENPTTILYLCTSKSLECRNYESDLKKIVEKRELQDDIVYVNLTDVSLSQFTHSFNESYPYKISLKNNYPAIVMFEDGKVRAVLQGDGEEKLTIAKTRQFIELNKIGE